MAGDLLDPLTAAGIAEAAVPRILDLLRTASARADAASASAAAAATARDVIVAAIAGIGLPVRWSGDGTSLSIRLPDGTYTAPVDLRGPVGPMRPAPSFVQGSASMGSAPGLTMRADPSAADRYIFDLVQVAGGKGDPGPPGRPGQDGAPGVSGAAFTAASTSAVAIALGTVSVVITPATATGFAVAQYEALISAADPRNAMMGALQGYDPATGTLTLAVLQASGAGTHADWIVTASLPPSLPPIVDDGLWDGAPPAAAVTIAYASAASSGSPDDDGTY